MHSVGDELELSEPCVINWSPAFRVISTRFPTVNIFDGIVRQDEFEILYEIEAATNPRVREALGLIALVPIEHRKYGPGYGPVMAPFTHFGNSQSRFSDGSYGAFYAAEEKSTAIAETRFHQARFLAATNTPKINVEMRLLTLQIQGEFADYRKLGLDHPIYRLDDYGASKAIANLERVQRAGIVYRSVRAPRGSCLVAFHPGPLGPCNPSTNLLYRWDGSQIVDVMEQFVT